MSFPQTWFSLATCLNKLSFDIFPKKTFDSSVLDSAMIITSFIRLMMQNPLNRSNLQTHIAPDMWSIRKMFFLFYHKNIHCGYSLEAPH